MMQRTAQELDARDRAVAAAAATVSGAAGTSGADAQRASCPAADAMFSGTSRTQRLQLELLVQSAVDQDAALVSVIRCLVGDDDAKCNAIVEAFRTNEPLREQWNGAWRELRS